MKKYTLNLIPFEADIVLIALNPTEEAIQNGAVFSRDNGLWNVLSRAGLIFDVSHIQLELRAKEVFQDQKHSNKKIGIADLLSDVFETDSTKVKVAKGTAKEFVNDQLVSKKVKRIALMGQKVVDAFHGDYNYLKSWRSIPTVDGEKAFGKIGDIDNIEVYAMPFPVNNSIKDKHKFFKLLLD